MHFLSISIGCFLLACLFPPAVQAQQLKIEIAIEDDAAPWSLANGQGYVNELIQLAYARVGVSVSSIVMPYSRCKADVLRAKVLACATMSRTPELDSALLFPAYPLINPHFLSFQLAGKLLPDCQTDLWAPTLRVAYVRGYEYTAELEALRQSIRVQEVSTEVAAIEMLQKSRVDLALLNLDEIKTLESLQSALPKTEPKKPLQLHCDFGSQPGFLAFAKNTPDSRNLMALFEQGMYLLHNDGTLTDLQQKWSQPVQR